MNICTYIKPWVRQVEDHLHGHDRCDHSLCTHAPGPTPIYPYNCSKMHMRICLRDMCTLAVYLSICLRDVCTLAVYLSICLRDVCTLAVYLSICLRTCVPWLCTSPSVYETCVRWLCTLGNWAPSSYTHKTDRKCIRVSVYGTCVPWLCTSPSVYGTCVPWLCTTAPTLSDTSTMLPMVYPHPHLALDSVFQHREQSCDA